MNQRNNALYKIRKLFPQVTKVRDARESRVVTVTEEDNSKARKKDPAECALARACVRNKIADHALIGIAYSYLIKGKVATRYKTSVSVGREITSFDRHQDFAAGINYRLSKVSKSNRLGEKRQGPQIEGPRTSNKPAPLAVHRTVNIREAASKS